MRDIIVTLMVFGTLPFILRNAYFGVLVWSWLSYMNPHRMCWGFAYNMPFAQIVAITLLVSMLASSEKKVLTPNPMVTVWAVFLAWLSFSAYQGLYQDMALTQLDKVLKIQLITFVTMLLMHSMERVNQLIWVIVFSIGYFSLKGGVFTLVSGGGFHIFGPDGSDIQENNALGVAILMIIPLMIYINRFPPHPLVKTIMPYVIFFSIVAVAGTQSRGAVVAIGAVGGFYWWKSKRKAFTGLIFVLLASFTLLFMPASWTERMKSITDYEQDSSAMERITAWKYSIRVANDRITGGGFNSWSLENYSRYGIYTYKAFVAHSIYFGVLNDGGWPGLILFLTILFLMWRQLSKVIRLTEGDDEKADINFLAKMLHISMVAFLAGGAFLSLAYFDLAWHLMAITIVLAQLTEGVSGEEGVNRKVKKPRKRAVAYGRAPRLPGRT